MADQIPACDLSGIREAVCIHTKKVTDACREEHYQPSKSEQTPLFQR